MAAKSIWTGILISSLAALTGCGTGKYVTTNLNSEDQRRVAKGELVKLQMVLPDNPEEKLVLTPATYSDGVFVCAIENMSQPCLPKLSELVADRLARKGIVIASEQTRADATLYFGTSFDTWSSHSSGVKAVNSNPTALNKDFAVKMEQGLATGMEPDVHKNFKFAADPLSLIAANTNDEQKFVFVSLSAVEMKNAIDYPGDGDKHLEASKNPRVKAGVVPASRTLTGNYDGEVATEKAVTPMFMDAIDLLAERVGHLPGK
jgi:hypothetical protein